MLLRRLLFSFALLLVFATPAVWADPVLIDPVGDTFGAGAAQLDITSVNGTVTGSILTFTVTFASNISPASSFAANSVVGFIDIDADQNPLTGAPSLQGIFGPPPAPLLGDEFFIDLSSEFFHPGFVDVVNATTQTVVGTASIIYTSSSFTISVPLALLGDDGIVNYGVIIGTFAEPTDEAPNGTAPGDERPAVVPEPTTLLLLGTGLAGVVGAARRRRKDN